MKTEKIKRQNRNKQTALLKFDNKADREALTEVKNYFGHKTNSSVIMFLIRKTADNIKSGRPLSILNQR